MRDASALCSELQKLQNVIGLPGNLPRPSEPPTARQYVEAAQNLLQHIETAEQEVSTSKLRTRLQNEAASLLVNIKQHVCEIVRYASAGASLKVEPCVGVPADEALIEQFEDLRDKCCYPLMDMVERISSILEATAMPADAMTPELATKLFCVTRHGLSQAVKDGQLQSYRDVHEPKSARRRFSKAQLAKLYERQP